MIKPQIKATHYMLFSISAFALFILMSYYASNTNIQTQLHGGHSHSAHALVASNDGSNSNSNTTISRISGSLSKQEYLGKLSLFNH